METFPVERIKLGLADDDSQIFIGRVSANGKRWLDKRDCTYEAIDSVRDFMIQKAGYRDHYSYGWKRPDGKNIILSVVILEEDKE